MTSFVIGSVAGAPGASALTVGLAAAWPDGDRRPIVLEADPDGGRLGAELGVGTEPGLMALAVGSRAGVLSADEVLATGAARVGGWWLVPAPGSAEHTHAALAQAGSSLARTVGAAREQLWLVDAGRIGPRSPGFAFAAVADLVVLVTGGSLGALQLLPTRVDALVGAGCPVAVVLVGGSDWPLAEIADFCGCDVLGQVPRVRSSAAGLRSMRSSAWRPWWAAVGALARHLWEFEATGPAAPAAVGP